MRPFRICKHVEDQDGRTNRQIQEQKRALKKLPWKRKSLVLAVFVLLPRAFPPQWKAGLIVEMGRIPSGAAGCVMGCGGGLSTILQCDCSKSLPNQPSLL